MRIRFVVAAVVVVAGLSAGPAVYAAPTNVQVPSRAMFAKTKTVKLSVRNDSGSTLELKAGDQVVLLDAGKTTVLNLPVGTRILLSNAIPRHQAGELLAEVSSDMKDATITIK